MSTEIIEEDIDDNWWRRYKEAPKASFSKLIQKGVNYFTFNPDRKCGTTPIEEILEILKSVEFKPGTTLKFKNIHVNNSPTNLKSSDINDLAKQLSSFPKVSKIIFDLSKESLPSWVKENDNALQLLCKTAIDELVKKDTTIEINLTSSDINSHFICEVARLINNSSINSSKLILCLNKKYIQQSDYDYHITHRNPEDDCYIEKFPWEISNTPSNFTSSEPSRTTLSHGNFQVEIIGKDWAEVQEYDE